MSHDSIMEDATQSASRLHRAQGGGLLGGINSIAPEGVNYQVENLVDNALSFRPPSTADNVQPTAEQKAHDAIAVMIRRELTTRAQAIFSQRAHNLELDRENAHLHQQREEMRKANESTINSWRKSYDAERQRADRYLSRLMQCANMTLDGIECELDKIPDALRSVFDQLVTRGLAAGLFDDGDDPLWMLLARITNRDPKTRNYLPEQGEGRDDA